MIDAYASEAHYLDHVLPVWQALSARWRGTFWLLPELHQQLSIDDRANLLGRAGVPRYQSDRPVLVASGKDLLSVGGARRAILLEHGAGQTYNGDPSHPVEHVAFAGGPDRERVALFLCPNAHVAAANNDRYPDAAQRVVGSPHLDLTMRVRRRPPNYDRPIVAFSFHWPSRVVLEAGTAWNEYRTAIAKVASGNAFTLIGTGHPRALPTLKPQYERMGIEVVPNWRHVVGVADLLVCDNSSVMYEWAALDRPVLTLNGKHWRRNVQHGLRFWTHVPGFQCDHPGELFDWMQRALHAEADSTWPAEQRAICVQRAYGGLADGHASERAATAIMEVFT